MSAGTRPGGLTVLGICNMIFGALNFMGAFGTVVMIFFGDKMSEMEGAQPNPMMELGVGYLIALTLLYTVTGILEMLSGIGYMGQKKVMGRYLGNAFAVAQIATSIFEATIPGLPFTLLNLSNFVYPVITVLLINIAFRDDLTQ